MVRLYSNVLLELSRSNRGYQSDYRVVASSESRTSLFTKTKGPKARSPKVTFTSDVLNY